MTSEQKGVDGGPAFPSPSFAVPRSLDAEHVVKLRDMQGMTLRDYFAAKELVSLTDKTVCTVASDYARYADHCYRMADPMLAERAKR